MRFFSDFQCWYDNSSLVAESGVNFSHCIRCWILESKKNSYYISLSVCNVFLVRSFVCFPSVLFWFVCLFVVFFCLSVYLFYLADLCYHYKNLSTADRNRINETPLLFDNSLELIDLKKCQQQKNYPWYYKLFFLI